MRKWTIVQDMAVIKAAENNPDHLRFAFSEVSKKIGRTPESVVTRYYNFLLKKNITIEILRFAEKHGLSYAESQTKSIIGN